MAKSSEIQIEGKRFLVINLTQPLKLDTEVFPGDPKPARKIFSKINETGYEHYTHEIGDHSFQPHADAPKHQNSELQDSGIEVFNNFNNIFNKACLIDLSEFSKEEHGDANHLIKIKKEHLIPFSENLKKVSAVIIRTGYDRILEENKEHTLDKLPSLNREAAEFLASFENLRVIGIDSLTIDPVGIHEAHNLLTKDKLVIESFVNLSEIPKENRNNFTLQTSPIMIVGSTGSPVVAYVYIKL